MRVGRARALYKKSSGKSAECVNVSNPTPPTPREQLARDFSGKCVNVSSHFALWIDAPRIALNERKKTLTAVSKSVKTSRMELKDLEQLTVRQTAAILRVQVKQVRKMMALGVLPYVRLTPHTTRISRAALEKILAAEVAR